MVLEYLRHDGHGRVDRVGDDEDVGIRTVPSVDWIRSASASSIFDGICDSLGAGSGQITNNAGVRVEEIVTRHARLAWNSGRDDDNLAILKSGLDALVVQMKRDEEEARALLSGVRSLGVIDQRLCF